MRSIPLAVGLLLLALNATRACADTVWVQRGAGAPLEYKDSTVIRLEGGELYFRTVGGTEIHREMSAIYRISVRDEPALNAAEEAFANRKWAEAAEGYERAMRSTAKPWVRDFAGIRMGEAAARSNRPDLALSAHVQTLLRNPQAVRGANVPLPPPDSRFITDAINQLDRGLAGNLRPEAQLAILEFRLALVQHRGDSREVDATLERIARLDPANPMARRAMVRKSLAAIRAQLDAGQHDAAMAAIDREADSFTDESDKMLAVFLVAEAKAAKAARDGSDTAWKEAALAYMLLPANFDDDHPMVGAAILKTAEILEKRLNDKPAAVALYKQAATAYQDQDTGRKAKEALSRLGGSQP